MAVTFLLVGLALGIVLGRMTWPVKKDDDQAKVQYYAAQFRAETKKLRAAIGGR